VSNLSTAIVGLAAGGSHTCALIVDGSAVCWGDNYQGDLGNGGMTQSTTPVPVLGW
jgi:alpha-tubulin suppressor-like RCC1 family protein